MWYAHGKDKQKLLHKKKWRFYPLPSSPVPILPLHAFVLIQESGSDESDSYYSSDGDETEGTEDGEAYATSATHDGDGSDTHGSLSAGGTGQGAAWAEASWETDKGIGASGGGGGLDDEPM